MVQRAAAACARGVYLARAASVGGSPRDQLAVAWGRFFYLRHAAVAARRSRDCLVMRRCERLRLSVKDGRDLFCFGLVSYGR